MIKTVYRLYCDQCGKEHKGVFDDYSELIKYTQKDGWFKKKVENGSIWYFCPDCLKNEK